MANRHGGDWMACRETGVHVPIVLSHDVACRDCGALLAPYGSDDPEFVGSPYDVAQREQYERAGFGD